MKIGIFTDYFINQRASSGGVGEVTYQLSRELAKSGHEVYVFTASATKKTEIYKKEGVNIFCYAKTLNFENSSLSFKLLYSPLKFDLDVVNVHSGTLSFFSAFIYKFLKGRPLVFCHHGEYYRSMGGILRRLFVVFWEEQILPLFTSKAEAVVVLSQGFAKKKYFKKLSNLQVIANGVHVKKERVLSKHEARRKLGLDQSADLVLFVGSLTSRKGPHILVKAMADVAKSFPKSQLVFVGPELGNRDKLATLTTAYSIERNVRFAGIVTRNDLNLFYNAADIFVMPSFSEGIPITLMEALAYGLPVVASDLEQLVGIVIDDFNGFLVKTGVSADFSSRIIQLLEDKEKLKRLSENAREKQNWTWQKAAYTYEKLFKTLVH